MGLQVASLLVVALVISCCGYTEARNAKGFFSDRLAHSTIGSKGQLHASEALCEMCEQYSTQALSYLNQNETQTEIISLLYNTCSKLQPLRQQCITLVDYYVPLFFKEVATISPDEFCERMHLCKETKSTQETNAIKLQTSGPACKLCNKAVLEILTKLQDPSTQLDILNMLFQACVAVKNELPKCYELVKQYTPEVINNAETFLQKADICGSVCKADVPAIKYIFTS